jgi:hypothetical protein
MMSRWRVIVYIPRYERGEKDAIDQHQRGSASSLENRPENTTWDDLIYAIYRRQAVEAGLADSEAGRTLDVQEVRAKFGLSK